MEFVLNEYHRNISEEDLLEDVKRVIRMTNCDTLSGREYVKLGKYSMGPFLKRFGSWNNVLIKCGIQPSAQQISAAKSRHLHQNVSSDELIADIQWVAKKLNADTISCNDYESNGHFSKDSCFRRFSTWDDALFAAGLKPYIFVPKWKIPDEELFKEIERMWILLGRQPTVSDIKNGVSKYSLNSFSRRFGGWRGALEAFVKWIDEDEGTSSSDDSIPSHVKISLSVKDGKAATPNTIIHKTKREPNLRLFFKVMKRDNYKCCICGKAPSKDPSVELHVDHIKPWSKGGETTIENLRTLCSKCNLGKGDLEE